jgi:hypothetical protein
MAEAMEAIRWVNVVLAFASLAVLVGTLTRRWDVLSHRIRRIGIAFCGVMAVIAYGSGEAASQDVPPGIRVVLMFLSLAGLVGALLWRFDEEL